MEQTGNLEGDFSWPLNLLMFTIRSLVFNINYNSHLPAYILSKAYVDSLKEMFFLKIRNY